MELKEQVPALLQCRLLTKVLDHWNQWVTNMVPGESGDLFWGV